MRSHDGLRDSLTHLASPGLFYEELRRELALAKRSGEPLSLLRLILRPDPPEIGRLSSTDFEIEVLSFGQTLKRLSRAEDVCSRIGNLEFLLLLRGSEVVASNLIGRIVKAWGGDLIAHAGSDYQCRVRLESSRILHLPGESALDFLNRLDREVQTTHISA